MLCKTSAIPRVSRLSSLRHMRCDPESRGADSLSGILRLLVHPSITRSAYPLMLAQHISPTTLQSHLVHLHQLQGHRCHCKDINRACGEGNCLGSRVDVYLKRRPGTYFPDLRYWYRVWNPTLPKSSYRIKLKNVLSRHMLQLARRAFLD